MVEEGLHQSGPTAEASKYCALAHTRTAGDGVHGECVDTSFGNKRGCGIEQKCPVTCSVAALDRLHADPGERGWGHSTKVTGRRNTSGPWSV
ncbi:hypothetical protein BDB13_2865 [Rhodococcus sp. OK302]|nr:hypothetical protein BDB13_2865 [Rhodococcus sp. OK302]